MGQKGQKMARVLNRLSAVKVAKARRAGMHCDGGGLYLRISASGSKSWIFRYHKRDMGLGSYPTVSLERAREEARSARERLAAGDDPIDARRYSGGSPATQTFEACAEAFVIAQEGGWRNERTAKRFRASMASHVLPKIGHLPISAIETRHALSVLTPIWHEKTALASAIRANMERILDFAKARGLRSSENPAAWRGQLAHLLPAPSKVHKTVHHPALPWRELPEFMEMLRERFWISARGLAFQIFTATRPGEALGARWDEIDLAGELWMIPAQRMKAHRPHRVPLSAGAMAIITEMPRLRNCPFIFPGMRTDRPINRSTVTRELLRRIDRADITAHGFRSTFRDWAGEATSFPREVAEMALAHAVGDASERSYARSDLFEKRRLLMEAWSNHCLSAGRSAEIVNLNSAVVN